jgi:hypothetical protein
MGTPDQDGPLSLAQAALRWCDERALEAVCRAEYPFAEAELATYHYPNLGGAAFRGQRPLRVDSKHLYHEHEALKAAWETLTLDFQRKVGAEKFFLLGVETRPERGTQRVPLPSVWAVDYEFDFLQDVVELGLTKRWVSVIASSDPGPSMQSARADLDDRDVVSQLAARINMLEPGDVARLLELHAEHVRAGFGVSLLPPGKASPLALVASMMRYRADRGELRPTITEEARWLERWCSEAAPSYQVVGEKTIMNKLGGLYRDLAQKSRSRP